YLHPEVARPRTNGRTRIDEHQVGCPGRWAGPPVTPDHASADHGSTGLSSSGLGSAGLGLPDAGPARFASLDEVRGGLAQVGYLADEAISGVVYLADRLSKPVLVEGPAGTGKTQLAKSVAELTGSRL